ncbi:HK97-gp10 family putative phage morphogenesis protein [Parafrankia sp. EUN1f]|uniref:HK97-gp10 family putative phage morphogenesis protein n=1 Tax=Parafrankia sp. EUN1f TaxID=102897 RepID=UPI0001C4569D|nr:HK97-gp10 family putative phage morphogenesis protein [Parafrankia sp. EUN1f]EFC78884.1 phage protein, HK97 gp10 family [Parafrankia sp. EUN1f]
MPRRQTVTIEGLDELAGAARRIGERVQRGVKQAVAESLDAVKTDAERRAPRLTGELQESGIDTQVDDDGQAGDVGFTRDGFYGLFQELGTSQHPPQPMLGPAAEAERAELPRRLERHIRRELGI